MQNDSFVGKRIKILFFINGIRLGGKERRMVELMKQLKNLPQFSLELVVMDSEINYPDVHDLGIRIHYLIRNTQKDLSVFFKFHKICKENKPDFVHCWDGMTAVYSVPACKLLSIKLINGMVVNCPTHKNILNKNWLRAKLTFPFSSIIIGNSKAGLSAYRSPLSKSIVIHNGYNFKRSENLVKKKILLQKLNIHTKYVVGMVATFSQSKDYDTYFKAANILLKKRNDITFLAIGNKTDSTISKELVEKFPFRNNFKLLGKIADIESYINILDIGVLATFTEGISNSIMEYMALEKPVIATDGGGTNEIVIDNETGFLIKVSDPVELSGKIEFLIENREKGSLMGKKGKERVEELFSIDGMVSKYVNVYHFLEENLKIDRDSFDRQKKK